MRVIIKAGTKKKELNIKSEETKLERFIAIHTVVKRKIRDSILIMKKTTKKKYETIILRQASPGY